MACQNCPPPVAAGTAPVVYRNPDGSDPAPPAPLGPAVALSPPATRVNWVRLLNNAGRIEAVRKFAADQDQQFIRTLLFTAGLPDPNVASEEATGWAHALAASGWTAKPCFLAGKVAGDIAVVVDGENKPFAIYALARAIRPGDPAALVELVGPDDPLKNPGDEIDFWFCFPGT